MCSDSSFPPGRPNVPVNRLPLRVQAQPGDALPVCRSSEELKVGARGSPVAFRGALRAIFPHLTNPNARLTVCPPATGGRSPPRPDPVVVDIYVQIEHDMLDMVGQFGDTAAQTARMHAEIADETLRNQS